MKKIISLLIALAMILGIVALTACGDKETPTTPSTESASTTSSGKSESTTSSSKATEGTTSSSATVDSTTASSDEGTTASSGESTLSGKEKHPDFMDVNFGGRSFNFIVAQGTQQDWDIYEITAEATGNDNIVTEAIIERNRTVESLYNCKITSTGSAKPEDVCSAELQTGTSQYDFCMPMSWNAKAKSCFYNIASMDIDLTHSWWDQNFIDGFGMTIDGTKRLYTLSGNFNLLNYDATWALFFNKDVYDKVIASGKSNIDIYDEARKGTWTVDKMILYPQYINYFKTQCFCEDEAGEMLEIVLGTREFDLGIFGQYGLSGKLDSYIQSGKNMLSKALASTSRTQTSAIEAYIVSLKNLKH